MAERRMFAKTIIDSDAFLDMPLSTQSLYFHLSMRGDDDGFINNPKKIQRMIGASDDDLKLLITKNFIIPFESGIVVIKHWKIHNYIRGDRKKDTVYPEEMSMLETKGNGAYTLIGAAPVPAIEGNNDLCETPRQKAYRESSLPYSFEYKIRQAFMGRTCPICGAIMQRDSEDGIETRNRIPTIQHNTPISKGGKHELGNISVICKECNVSLQDTKTDRLNALEVIEEWEKICNDSQVTVKRQSDDSQVTAQDRIGKDSIGEYRVDKGSIEKNRDNLKEKDDDDNNNYIKKSTGEASKDNHHNHLCKIFVSSFGRQPSAKELDSLRLIYKTWDTDLCEEAIARAALNGQPNLGYVKGILNNWEKEGIKTYDDYAQRDIERRGI